MCWQFLRRRVDAGIIQQGTVIQAVKSRGTQSRVFVGRVEET